MEGNTTIPDDLPSLLSSPSKTTSSSPDNSSFGAWFPGPHSPYGPVAAVIIVIVLLCVVVGTVVGNILVCVAVCLVRKLRRPCNYLLVSLAVSDICVALLVMPMALLYEVLGQWSFGPVACDLWVSFDVLSCTASILNLCMISVDRYYAITKPLEYGVKRTPRRMIGCVSLVWLGAACISLPPLLIPRQRTRVPPRDRRHPLLRVPELWLPDLRNVGIVLHPSDGDDRGVLQDLQGGEEDRAGRAEGADAPGDSQLPGDQRQEWRGATRDEGGAGRHGNVHDVIASGVSVCQQREAPGQLCQHQHHHLPTRELVRRLIRPLS
uniref:G-protein coupled receptors family 1 profile domain-containing protein n=1 Tax=Timema genevievae TaxID=629358 RepID=A0A7R9PHQ1_TIMGE|nr:unnamed protein product [Timema genevievae]